jgi:hypothetical protein
MEKRLKHKTNLATTLKLVCCSNGMKNVVCVRYHSFFSLESKFADFNERIVEKKFNFPSYFHS